MSANKQPNSEFMSGNPQGFILLEVLVAMSMILGVWMASVGTYQHLALKLVQQETKRSQLRKEFDAFEIQELVRANLNQSRSGLSHDATRVPSRNRSMRAITQPYIANKR